MTNIFRQMTSENFIFKDESYLRSEYIPEEMPGRETQMKEIAAYLQDAVKGHIPPSILITGRPGTGKTTMARSLLKQLIEVSRKPKEIYINCWENSTRFGILNKIVIELGDMLPRRGIATDEVVLRIAEIGKRKENIAIIVLDEVDRLMASTTGDEQILYDLSRAKDALGLDASVIAITNDEEIGAKLDERIRSSLTNHIINFKPYGPTQLKQILKQRAKLAFWPNAIDDDVIGLCAAIGAKAGGDARLTIHLLWAAGKKAESKNAKKVTVEHVKEVKKSSYSQATTPINRKISELDELDKKIIGIIKNSKTMLDTGTIYRHLGVKGNEQRNVRLRLERLLKAKMINAVDKKKGVGRTRIWSITKTSKD